MSPRSLPTLLLSAALAAGLAALPAAAPAAGATLAEDPAIGQLTALDETIVWVTGEPGNRQTLMRYTAAGGAERVPGAPDARFYRSIDLGRDRDNALVLTYLRCDTVSRCVARQDDLDGGRRGIRGLTLKGCTATTAPALWRTRAVVGQLCRKGRTFDARRSGVYVRSGAGRPRKLRAPSEASRRGADEVTAVDVRGTRAAATLADVYAYAAAFDLRRGTVEADLVAASEGDGDQRASGLSLGAGDALWSLTQAEHAGDPPQAVISRMRAGDCRESEVLTAEPAAQRHPAVDVAADGGVTYLAVPGTGLVSHPFRPRNACP